MTTRFGTSILAVLLALLPSVLHGTPPRASAAGLGIRKIMHPTRAEGLAVLGSRYLYVGASTRNAVHIYNARSLGKLATWHLAGALAYDMTRMAASPDNRYVYILNQIRADVVAVDVTGKTAPRDLNVYPQHNGIPTGLKVSRDGRVLFVLGGAGADMYAAATGAYLGRIPGVDAVAPGPGSSVYSLTLARGQATIQVRAADGSSRVLARYSGNRLSDLNGDIALSPNGRVVYALWDSFRAFNASSGRALGTVSLPLAPHFTGIALAPNGQQAIIWAPSFTAVIDTPGYDPSTVFRHYGFIAGGMVPISLTGMRPVQAHLESVHNPHQVQYSADSSTIYATGQNMLAVIGSGTAGADRSSVPTISLRNPTPSGQTGTGSGSGQGTGTGTGTGTGSNPPKAVSCTVSGAWNFITSAAGAGPGSGQSTLQQSGGTVSGTIATGAVTWKLSGTISHRTLTLTMQAPGQIQLNFSGEVSTSGASITGNLGTFTGGHATCTTA